MQKKCFEVDVGGQDRFLVLRRGLFGARPMPDHMEADADQLFGFVRDIVQGAGELSLARSEGGQGRSLTARAQIPAWRRLTDRA